MTHDNDNPFADFETEFKNADKAEPGTTPGRVPPGTYRVVLSSVDLKGDGQLVDHEYFNTQPDGNGTKAVKIFMEILEPEETVDVNGEAVRTKGMIHEHVFWATTKNMPYLKRDTETILGRPLENLNEMRKIAWAGKTCEVGIKDELYQGFKRSKTAFINAWTPVTEAKTETKKVGQPAKPAAGQTQVRKSAQPAGKVAPKGNVDF